MSSVQIRYPAPQFRVISSAVESLPYTQFVGSSILSSPTKIPVLSSMDRMLGFEPSGVGSIPAGPAMQGEEDETYDICKQTKSQ